VRTLLAIAGVVIFAAIAVAASVAREQTPVTQAAPRYTPQPVPADAATPEPRPLPPGRAEAVLAFHFVVPLADASVPDDPDLLPGAPRDYRAGIHEGIDFPAPLGTPVFAASDGTVIRVDSVFRDWTPLEQQAALAEAQSLGYTPAVTLDRIRGRQVWIDHGRGVITRYAHLSAVAELAPGERVSAGAVIGAVGSSGYPQGGPHLHFEVRLDEYYAGDELSGDALRLAVVRLFR